MTDVAIALLGRSCNISSRFDARCSRLPLRYYQIGEFSNTPQHADRQIDLIYNTLLGVWILRSDGNTARAGQGPLTHALDREKHFPIPSAFRTDEMPVDANKRIGVFASPGQKQAIAAFARHQTRFVMRFSQGRLPQHRDRSRSTKSEGKPHKVHRRPCRPGPQSLAPRMAPARASMPSRRTLRTIAANTWRAPARPVRFSGRLVLRITCPPSSCLYPARLKPSPSSGQRRIHDGRHRSGLCPGSATLGDARGSAGTLRPRTTA